MKLITLNTWGGRVHKDLIQFFENNQDIDIFCLQEVYDGANIEDIRPEFRQGAFDLFLDISKTLFNHKGYFRPHIKDWYGLAVFIKSNIKVNKEGDILIHDAKHTLSGNHSRNLQYIEIVHNEDVVTVANVHGLWNGKGKNDTDERIIQSEKIKDFIDSVNNKNILCGDFNLNPDTYSLKMLENNMTNLINKYSIKSTRTGFYDKPGKYADYIFTSPDIKIIDFKVLPEEISDHAALYLEFN